MLKGGISLRLIYQFGRWFKALGAGDLQVKAQNFGGIDVGLTHIIPISQPTNCFPLNVAAVLYPRLHVCQKLTGVIVVGEGVDHRNAGMRGK